MMKKIMVCILIILLLLTGCGKRNKQELPVVEEPTVTTGEIEQTTQSEEQTEAPPEVETEVPTEVTIPCVEDSIFDENGDVITVPTETTEPQQTTEPTVPKETKPSGDTTVVEPSDPKPTEPKPTEPKPTEPESTEPEPTVPEHTEPEPTEPEPTEPKPTEPKPPVYEPTEFEKFQALSPADQQAYMESFESIEDFFEWYNRVKAEHDSLKPPIDVGDGNIDLDEVIGK